MRTFTFKVIPDPQVPPINKTASKPQTEGKTASQTGGNCPPSSPYSPGAPQIPYMPVAPPPPFEGLPPFETMPPFQSIPFFEPVAPPQMPNPPFQGQYPFPNPEPLIPVPPGYTTRPWVAHAYVPWQFYAMAYNPGEALTNGTLFPELNQPQGEYGPCEGPQPCMMVYPRGGAPDAN